MKRIGRPEPKPFIIRRDGTLIDRESTARIGKVYLDRWLGWVAIPDAGEYREFLGHGRRTEAAERAWVDWHQRRNSVSPMS